ADESFTSLRLTMPVGASLEYADERVQRVEQALREFKEIEVIDTSIGTEGGKNTARINLRLVPRSHRHLSQKDLERAIRKRRTALEDIANLNIATGRALADGMPEVVPLRSVATIERVFNPENIRRQDLQRRIALFANVEGRPAGDAGEEVKALVKSYALPPGLRLSVGGQIEDQEEVNQAIVGALAMAIIFIYIVLASQFGSFIQPVAIMVSLPLSVVGVMLALLFTGTTLNI